MQTSFKPNEMNHNYQTSTIIQSLLVVQHNMANLQLHSSADMSIIVLITSGKREILS